MHDPPEIDRSHLLRTMTTQLSGGVDLLLVEGMDGIGKTVLLRQCASKLGDSCIGVFISGASRWTYHPGHISARITQEIGRVTSTKRLEQHDHAVDDRELARAYAILQRHASRSADGIYVIMDGVDSIPIADLSLRKAVLGLLPIGIPNIKCIISTRDPTGVMGLLGSSLTSKSLLLTNLPERDVKAMLAPLELSDENLTRAIDITDGIPGRLAQLRRVLLASEDVEGVLSAPERTLPDLYRMEWQGVTLDDASVRLAVAVLAHEPRGFSIEDLSAVANVDPTLLASHFSRLSVLASGPSGAWMFRDESMRRFAEIELADLRPDVTDCLIAHYTSDPDGGGALTELPSFLEHSQRYQELVDFLSPDRFARMYQTMPSVSLVKSHAERGMRAAEGLDRQADVVRFSLQRSALEEMTLSHSRLMEVRARVAVGDEETAIAVAESVPHPEVKLRLLAAAVRTMHDYGRGDEAQVLDRVRHLLGTVDLGVLGHAATEIAVDLFPRAPDLAMSLFQKHAQASGDENALDKAIVRLSIEALASGQAAFIPGNEPGAEEQPADDKSRRLALVASVVLGDLRGEEVIAEATKLSGVADQLYILQHWMRGNSRRPDALRVCRHGLELGLRTTGFSLNASTVLGLIRCLPYSDGFEPVRNLIELLDGQRAALEAVGPLEDAFRIRLIVAQTVWLTQPDSGQDRMLEVLDAIADISDPGARVALWARLYATLKRIPQEVRTDSALEELAGEELRSGTEALLVDSAFQFAAIASVLRALALEAPREALELVARMNTRRRRDRAYELLIREATRAPLDRVPWGMIHEAIPLIWDQDVLLEVLSETCEFVAGARFSGNPPEPAVRFLRKAFGMPKATVRLLVCSRMLSRMSMSGSQWGPIVSEIRGAVRDSWRDIPASRAKVDHGYDVIAEVAKSDASLANDLIGEVNALTARADGLDSESVLAATVSTHLALRALASMASHRQEREDDLGRLTGVIARLPDPSERVRLLDDVACRLYFGDRKDMAEEILTHHIRPAIEVARSAGDPAAAAEMLVRAAPSLYLAAGVQAIEEFRRLAPHLRESALQRAFLVLLRRVPVGEPFREVPGQGMEITYDDATSMLTLIRMMDEDHTVYASIIRMTDALRVSGASVKRAQMPLITDALRRIVSEKLPDQNNIAHDGYVILAEAAIGSLTGTQGGWRIEDAIRNAQRIPNVSDRAFVLGELSRYASRSRGRSEAVEAALVAARQIPLLSERVTRIMGVARVASDWSATAAKEILTEAMAMLAGGKAGTTASELRRDLISDAYRIDPDFAASLASSSDSDPATRSAKRDLAAYRLKDHFVGRGRQGDWPTEADRTDVSAAAWMALGELNAKRISASAPGAYMRPLQEAARQPVSDAYPVFAWFIENAVRHRSSSGAVRTYVTPLWEACLNGAQLALLAGRNQRAEDGTLPGSAASFVDPAHQGAEVIPAGGRRQAIAMMEEWVAGIEDPNILIIDPYFGPEDMRLIAILRDANPDIHCHVLTGGKHLRSAEGAPGENFRYEWERTREDDPPPTTVVFLETRKSKKCPVHDRWILSKKSGMQLGTSANGLGSRVSTVRIVDEAECISVRNQVDGFLGGTETAFDGERLNYTSIKL